MILHEYGHAIHVSQNFDFGGEGGAISEGFGDYWAVTVSDHISPTPDEPCVADWDSVSYTSRCRTACGASTRTCTTRRT